MNSQYQHDDMKPRNLSGVPQARYQRGQGMVEYIIIVAMIALAAIGAFTFFGDAIRGQTAQMASQVAGENNTTGSEAAASGAKGANKEAGRDVNLSNFDEADAQGSSSE